MRITVFVMCASFCAWIAFNIGWQRGADSNRAIIRVPWRGEFVTFCKDGYAITLSGDARDVDIENINVNCGNRQKTPTGG